MANQQLPEVIATDPADTITETGKLESATEDELRTAVESFRSGFLSGSGEPLGGEELPEGDHEVVESREQIVRSSRG